MPAPTVTPNGATMRGKAVLQFQVTVNGPATWATTAGTLWNDAAATTPYVPGTLQASVYLKAKNESGAYTITATNAGAEATVKAVAVTSVAVSHPSWGFSGEYGKDFLEFIPETGAADREVVEHGDLKYKADLTTNVRQAAEFAEFLEHFRLHYGSKKNFYFTHPGTGTEYLCYYDALLKEEWRLNNLVGFSTVIREV